MGHSSLKVGDLKIRKYPQEFELDRVNGSPMWIEAEDAISVLKDVRDEPEWFPRRKEHPEQSDRD